MLAGRNTNNFAPDILNLCSRKAEAPALIFRLKSLLSQKELGFEIFETAKDGSSWKTDKSTLEALS